MEHDDLLGGDPGPAAAPENLEGVLRRHLRRRRRLTAGVASAVLVISLGGGAAVGEMLASSGGAGVALNPRAASSSTNPTASPDLGSPPVSANGGAVNGSEFGHSDASGTPPTGLVWGTTSAPSSASATVSSPSTSTSATAAGGSEAICGSCDIVRAGAKRLFERTADGVALRVYSLDFSLYRLPAGEPAGEPEVQPKFPVCDPYSSLLVEASDSGAVGEVTVPDPQNAPRPVDVVDLQVLGVTEGSPFAVLVVRTSSSVHDVVATFGTGARDEMAVVNGVAVLATVLPSGATGTSATSVQVEALGASGQSLEHFSVPQAPAFAEPRLCLPMLPGGVPTPPRGGATGSAGGGTGSVGSGGASSGSAPAGKPSGSAG